MSGAIAVDTAAEAAEGDGTTAAVEAQAAVPALVVVSGSPTAEELAALVAVLTALGSGAPDSAPAVRRVSGWTDRSRYVRGEHPHGRAGWRAAAFPR